MDDQFRNAETIAADHFPNPPIFQNRQSGRQGIQPLAAVPQIALDAPDDIPVEAGDVQMFETGALEVSHYRSVGNAPGGDNDDLDVLFDIIVEIVGDVAQNRQNLRSGVIDIFKINHEFAQLRNAGHEFLERVPANRAFDAVLENAEQIIVAIRFPADPDPP